jgi:hypothetical protein
MLTNLALILIGFSIFSCLLLLLAYIFAYGALEKTAFSVSACAGLLVGLAGLQNIHLQYLQGNIELIHSHVYTGLLLITPPCLYIFGRQILQFNARVSPLLLLHFIPLLISPFIQTDLLIPIAFVLGTAYSLRVSFLLYALKSQRQNFKLEFSAFASFALIAVFILILGLLSSRLGERIYVLAYADLIGLAFFAMIYILLRFPDITQKTVDAVIATYAASTLKNVDCNALTMKVKQLFVEQKLHRNENLSLAPIKPPSLLTPNSVWGFLAWCGSIELMTLNDSW